MHSFSKLNSITLLGSRLFKRDIFVGSLNNSVIDFVPVQKSKRPFLFSKPGFKELWYRCVLASKRIIGVFHLKKSIPTFSRSDFLRHSTNIYCKFVEALNRRDHRLCREVVTESVYFRVRGLLSAKKSPDLQKPNITNAKIISIAPVEIKAKENVKIFQVAVDFSISAGRGKLEDVTHDYIIFEYCPEMFEPKWRIRDQIKESDHYFQ